TAPAAGARPFRNTIAPTVVPPVIVEGTDRLWSDGGSTVIAIDAVDVPIVAVSVTGVATVTCPVWKLNGDTAKPAGTVTPGGAGARVVPLERSRRARRGGAAGGGGSGPPPGRRGRGGAGGGGRRGPGGGPGGLGTGRPAPPAVPGDGVGLAAPWNERTRQNL